MRKFSAGYSFIVLIYFTFGVSPVFAQWNAPHIDPQDSRRFVWKDEAWVPVGYTPGLGAFTVRRDGVPLESYARAFHAWLEARGINTYRTVFSFGQAFRGEKTAETLPYEAVGEFRFDLDRFNEEHFDYWRRVIEDARAHNIVVRLSLFDSWHLNKVEHGNGWGRRYDFYYGENNVNGVTFDLESEAGWHDANENSAVYRYQRLLVDKVVAELGDLPNLIWEICNEPGEYYDSWAKPLARYLRRQDAGRHLVVPLDFPDHQHTPGQRRPEHKAAPAHAALMEAFESGLPLLSHNDSPKSFLSAVGQRRKLWAVFTAGAYIDYFFNLENLKDLTPGLPADRGARFLGYLPRFIADFDVDLRDMTPHDDLVSAPLAGGSWCLARPGEEYIVYKRRLKGNTSVTVTGLPEKYHARWFDPREGHGNFSPAQGTMNGEGIRFTPPNRRENDWVLHIRGEDR